MARGKEPLAAPRARPSLPATTSEQLLSALLHVGGHVISRQPHGVLLKVRQRLVFIPSTPWVSEGTVVDALRAADISPDRFLEMRAASR